MLLNPYCLHRLSLNCYCCYQYSHPRKKSPLESVRFYNFYELPSFQWCSCIGIDSI